MVSGVRKEAMLALKENNLMKEKNPLYPSAADSFSFKPKDYYSYFVEKVKKVLTKKKNVVQLYCKRDTIQPRITQRER